MSQPDTPTKISTRGWVALGVLLCATFTQLIDINIVNIAIPSIQSQLNTTFASAELVVAGYQMTFAGVLMIAAKLGDRFGTKRMFLIGMAGFTLSSLGCAISSNQVELVTFRLLQGAFSATMFPQVLTYIQVEFPRRQLSRILAIYGAVSAVAYLVGPAASGLILHFDPFGLGWRAIFLVNIPIGAFALISGPFLLRGRPSALKTKLDYVGAILFGIFVAMVVFPLAYGRESGWPTWLILILAGSPVPLVGFVINELRRTRGGLDVLIPAELLASASFRRGILLTLTFFMALSPFLFAFTLYLQLGRSFSPLYAGITTLPYATGAAILSIFSYRISRRLGRSSLTLGSVILLVSMVLLYLVLQIQGTSVNGFSVAPVLLLAGAGLGIFEPTVNTVVLSGVTRRGSSAASGGLLSVQQLAGALGIGVLGLIYFALLGTNASYAATAVTPAIKRQLTAFSTTPRQNSTIVGDFNRCVLAQATERDPTVTPSSCIGLGNFIQNASIPSLQKPIALGILLQDAGRATSLDFTKSIKEGTIYEMVLFASAALISRTLPKRQDALNRQDLLQLPEE